MPKKVDITPEVRALLERCRMQGNVLILPEGQLERPLYAAFNKVLKALGGKWNRRAGGHVLPEGIDGDQIRAVMEDGYAVDQKRTYEQFFTPEGLAGQMADIARIIDGMHVLEPSAGDGRLVRAALARGALVTAVEVDPTLCEALSALYAEAHGMIHVFAVDFLEWTPISRVPIDRVLMNPPFGNRVDIRHVRHAYNWLRPGGRLVSIMSPHWTFAVGRAATDFALWVRGLGGDWTMLPEGTFKREGTGVNAGILIIDKPE